MSVGDSNSAAVEDDRSSFHPDLGRAYEEVDDESSPESASTSTPLRSLPPEPPMQARLAVVRAASNPLLEAVRPLLRALADMQEVLDPERIDVLHRLLSREVESFQSVCNSAQIRHEHVVGASYALCTALDERAHSTRWGAAARNHGAGVWAGRQLAVVFHDDARGGDKVFLLIGRLVAAPDEHIDLIEVLYFVLGLGFEGRYGAAANGRRQIETVRHRLHALLVASRAEVPHALSPRSPGASGMRSRGLRLPPPWLTGLAVVLVLLLVLGVCKYRLLQLEADAIRRISAIGTAGSEALAAKPGKALRLKDLLATEIARGTVDVEENAARSAVTFRGDEMFVPGQARLNARLVPVLMKVAAEIAQVPGAVEVAGHSDNRPVRNGVNSDNQALSERRAAAVAEVLEAHGVEHYRMTVVGRSDTEPVADNVTAAGRARNRRVDIVVKLRDPAAPASGGSTPTPHTQQR